MAKYFLGSVGKAEAFRKKGNTMELAFVSKTLTDSGLNISTTKDDIRAGQGAPIQFSFYHDPSVEITLTDVLWKPEYLEAQLGANFETGLEDYITDPVTFSAAANSSTASASYEKIINKSPLPCGEDYLVWGAPKGTDDWKIISYNEGTKTLSFELPQEVETKTDYEYCIRYLGPVTSANEASIYSLIIPEELFLIITTPVFAGDACAPSKGKAAGHITFEVPRFQLNGAQEFAFNMSSNQTMSLSGTALAATSEDCDDSRGGKLLRVIEFIEDRNWKLDVSGLLVDGECEVAGEKPVVYAELKDGKILLLDYSDLEIKTGSGDYAPLTNSFVFAAGTSYQFRLKGYNAIVSEVVAIPGE